MRTFGADVSHWEGDIDWIKGVDYLPFVYYKATDGMYFIDSQFGLNKDECDQVGMPHAPYHWWQETQDPIIQANHFCDTLADAGDGFKQVIVDVEPQVIVPNMVTNLKRLLDRIEARRGRKPAIYTSNNYWSMLYPPPSWASQYELLVAQYAYRSGPILPVGWSNWIIWQFTDQFWFSGCNATADGNWFNGTLDQARQWFGNYRPVNPPVEPPAISKTILRSYFDNLHIRQWPDVSAHEVGHLAKGDTIELEELGGSDVWVKHEKGWTAVEIDGYRFMEVVK